MLGAFLIFMTGLVDDIKHGGLDYRVKFLVQIVAAIVVISFGIQIKFIQPQWLATIMTMIWIVGVTNAFNIIDIMDGLSSGVGVIVCLSFLFISLPTEEIYVNFAAAALAGGAMGFIPFNLSKRWRIFMGDSGSLLIGFITGSLSLGTNYTAVSRVGVIAPILILGIPIFDTILVFILRITRGMSPFLGSKDHFPLRLERLGWNRKIILVFIWGASIFSGACAAMMTRFEDKMSLLTLGGYVILLIGFTTYLLKAKTE